MIVLLCLLVFLAFTSILGGVFAKYIVRTINRKDFLHKHSYSGFYAYPLYESVSVRYTIMDFISW
jgi:hypothetical protein